MASTCSRERSPSACCWSCRPVPSPRSVSASPHPACRLRSTEWQVDIWRELRNSRDAAILRFQAAVEKRNYFVTRLVADVADNYYTLMALDKRYENLDQIIKLQQVSLQISEARYKEARSSELPV